MAFLPSQVVIVSPHLDDGVFSCGGFLSNSPGQTVLTIFAGGPEPESSPCGLTSWDAASGFQKDDDVMALRRNEDEKALRLLGAKPWWLDFWDSQYGRPVSAFEIAEALEAAFYSLSPHAVFFPAGLYHSDHRLTHDACLLLAKRMPLDWFLYEDAIYRRYQNYSAQMTLHQLRESGFHVEEAPNVGCESLEEKRRAVRCYRSQLRALRSTPGHPGYGDVFNPERFYRVRS